MKKLVVITGASSGIGESVAKRMSKAGHPVLLLARRSQITEGFHLPDSLCRSVDVTDLAAMKAAIAEAESLYGKTDLLINCAGVMLLDNPYDQDYAEWQQMVDVNINGVLTGINIVLHDMVARQEGTIINISSIAGRKTFPSHSVYCGTKFAVHAITENIREEVAPSNVRLITIAPGVVETPLLSHTTNEEIKQNYQIWKKEIQSGLDPEKIADCIQFAYQQPQDVCIREIVIAKTRQAG
ncbi:MULTISPECIES: SDR family oxidoreductase [Morganella]|uniref:SDR family oxidoreductase n=1 Tax=Morganella TaxID=581 RepID=UPI00040A6558|nr:SDR family oxidoreductase [Morganella morganii]EKW3935080.1 SDR family oxidoreductase [Morganella morganii]EKW3941133.1 SDR family oxidoreductase [Morganella morganii]ELA7708933.1 SDR family oxidoreductase [Morganella morganii]ELA7735228.1 SDR family oxidoreductase [Morganella morganii]KGP45788.1 oxidoreductase [Morganella morganii]